MALGDLRPITTGTVDGIELTCPAGHAVAGGFSSDSGAVLLNGSHPGSMPSTWIIEATNLGSTDHMWQANVTCSS